MYRIPKEWSIENLRNEIKKKQRLVIKDEPRLMKKHPNGKTFLLCFGSAEHYLKCEKGALLQYQKFPMRICHRRSVEADMAYKLKNKGWHQKSVTDTMAEAEDPDSLLDFTKWETNVSQTHCGLSSSKGFYLKRMFLLECL